MSSPYIYALEQHYRTYFGVNGVKRRDEQTPTGKLDAAFYVLEIPPGSRHNFYCYCTVGMSEGRIDGNNTELILFSPEASDTPVTILSLCASHHRNTLPINLHHTLNFGIPWLNNAVCDHGFVSLPYLDGEDLELVNDENVHLHCYWLIPITKQERDYKIAHGVELLEQLFEDRGLDYLNPNRNSLV